MIPEVGNTYNFRLPSGDSYIGEVDETNGKHVILRPGYSAWLIEYSQPQVAKDSYVQFNIDDPRVLIYDAEGELV